MKINLQYYERGLIANEMPYQLYDDMNILSYRLQVWALTCKLLLCLTRQTSKSLIIN